jgi:hypothetical protein
VSRRISGSLSNAAPPLRAMAESLPPGTQRTRPRRPWQSGCGYHDHSRWPLWRGAHRSGGPRAARAGDCATGPTSAVAPLRLPLLCAGFRLCAAADRDHAFFMQVLSSAAPTLPDIASPRTNGRERGRGDRGREPLLLRAGRRQKRERPAHARAGDEAGAKCARRRLLLPPRRLQRPCEHQMRACGEEQDATGSRVPDLLCFHGGRGSGGANVAAPGRKRASGRECR